ncbi:MAG: hypothetical protein AAGK05_03675 [Pseudomonadota bacterium]
MIEKLIMFSNDFATLTHYKSAFKKKLSDYVIHFHEEQIDFEIITNQTFDVVQALVEDYRNQGKIISGRLIALVNYFQIENEEIVPYYHASYQTERIDNVDDFYFTHMMKICDRMENFNHHGSNLIIKEVKEIHLHINVLN